MKILLFLLLLQTSQRILEVKSQSLDNIGKKLVEAGYQTVIGPDFVHTYTKKVDPEELTLEIHIQKTESGIYFLSGLRQAHPQSDAYPVKNDSFYADLICWKEMVRVQQILNK